MLEKALKLKRRSAVMRVKEMRCKSEGRVEE